MDKPAETRPVTCEYTAYAPFFGFAGVASSVSIMFSSMIIRCTLTVSAVCHAQMVLSSQCCNLNLHTKQATDNGSSIYIAFDPRPIMLASRRSCVRYR